MLEATGWTDSTFYNDDGRERGTAVHKLTADYDLGALDLSACVSRYRPYLLGHAMVMAMLKPEILAVEESIVHPVHRFGGRPDRVWRLAGALALCDIKTGEPEKSHQIQTALQAILVSVEHDDIPPDMIERYTLYLTPKGKGKLEEHKNRRNLDKAREIIKSVARDRRGDRRRAGDSGGADTSSTPAEGRRLWRLVQGSASARKGQP
jgi:hypothetical protein